MAETRSPKLEEEYPEFDELLTRVATRVEELTRSGASLFYSDPVFVRIETIKRSKEYKVRAFNPDFHSPYSDYELKLTKDNNQKWHFFNYCEYEEASPVPHLGIGVSGGSIKSEWAEGKYYTMPLLQRLNQIISAPDCKEVKIET